MIMMRDSVNGWREIKRSFIDSIVFDPPVRGYTTRSKDLGGISVILNYPDDDGHIHGRYLTIIVSGVSSANEAEMHVEEHFPEVFELESWKNLRGTCPEVKLLHRPIYNIDMVVTLAT